MRAAYKGVRDGRELAVAKRNRLVLQAQDVKLEKEFFRVMLLEPILQSFPDYGMKGCWTCSDPLLLP